MGRPPRRRRRRLSSSRPRRPRGGSRGGRAPTRSGCPGRRSARRWRRSAWCRSRPSPGCASSQAGTGTAERVHPPIRTTAGRRKAQAARGLRSPRDQRQSRGIEPPDSASQHHPPVLKTGPGTSLGRPAAVRFTCRVQAGQEDVQRGAGFVAAQSGGGVGAFGIVSLAAGLGAYGVAFVELAFVERRQKGAAGGPGGRLCRTGWAPSPNPNPIWLQSPSGASSATP